MSGLKEFLTNLLDDLTTIEVAILEKDASAPDLAQLKAYSRLEQGGDMLNLLNSNAPATEEDLAELHDALIKTSLGARLVLREILIMALK